MIAINCGKFFIFFLSCNNLGKFSFTSVVEKKCQVDSTFIMQTAAVAVWTKWYLAREVFDTFGAGLSRSELEQDSSSTHQFAGHSLPGGRVLSQVDFPKWALGHKARARVLIGQSPWEQQHVRVDLIAAFFYQHVLLRQKRRRQIRRLR